MLNALSISVLLGLLAAPVASEETPADPTVDRLTEALQHCRTQNDAALRLVCFDRLARDNAPPDYAGKLGFRTEPFELSAPTRLRYRSQGVIFVLYVLDERGQVLQNLHLGGGGEDEYVIESPGRYSLQIDGSARWQIWLEAMDQLEQDS